MKVTASASAKVNIGNYESRDLFIAISDIEVGATEEEIEAALDTAHVAVEAVKGRLREKIKEIRDEGR